MQHNAVPGVPILDKAVVAAADEDVRVFGIIFDANQWRRRVQL
jgi:hypothetical protein